MHKEIVRLEKVSLSLRGNAGEVRILQDISLTLQPAQKLAVTGPSGSGKTSLLMLIGGLEKPSSGSLTVCDVNYPSADEEKITALRNGHIGIVFQQFHLISDLTALENVRIPLELAGKKDSIEKAMEALEQVGLKERVHHYPSELSGGEQQRVAIARAFASHPKLLLADEPTGNLDRATGELVMDKLFSMCDRHQTALMLITHDATLAARCSQRIRLDSGRLVA